MTEHNDISAGSEDIVAMARAAQHDDRLADGALYGKLADAIERQREVLRHANIDLCMLLPEIADGDMAKAVRETLDMIDGTQSSDGGVENQRHAARGLRTPKTAQDGQEGGPLGSAPDKGHPEEHIAGVVSGPSDQVAAPREWFSDLNERLSRGLSADLPDEVEHDIRHETRMVYVKRWRTLVRLPAKYADEIVAALRIPTDAQASPERIRETAKLAIRTFCHSLSPAAVQMSHGTERIYYAGISLDALAVAVSLALTRPGLVEGVGLTPAPDRKDQGLVEEDGSTPSLAATSSVPSAEGK